MNDEIEKLRQRVQELEGLEVKHRKSVEMLLDSEHGYRLMLEQLLDGVAVIVGPEPRILFANPALGRILGRTTEEIKSLGPDALFGMLRPEDRKAFAERFQQRMAGQLVPSHYEIRVARRDGDQIWLELSVTGIEHQGKPAALTTVVDITARKQTEDALIASAEKFRLAFERAKDAIFWADPETGLVTKCNEAATILLEKTKEEIEGHHQTTLHPPDKADGYATMFAKHIEHKGWADDEAEVVTKSGRIIPVHITASITVVGGKPILQGIFRDITERKRTAEQLQLNFEKLERTMEMTIHAMARVVETRDPFTSGHQRRVANLATAIGHAMSLSADDIMGLRMAALIHDIGKIYVPAEILSRPSKLTNSEFALIKNHPRVGHDILKTIDFPWPVAQIVLQHHERLNGSGYPAGLADDQIILQARVLTVADVVEAMSSHRPYRPARPIDITIDEITQNRGVLYDPQVVDCCIRLLVEKEFGFD